MKKKFNNQWLIYFALFCIGITIGDCVDYGYFELNKSISVIDALTLFITIGLTWYIATILDKQSKNEQQQTALIVELINDISDLLRDIDILIQKESSYNEICLKIHCIGLVNKNLFDFLNENKDKNTISPFENSLKEKQKKLKDLLTGTPINKNDFTKMIMKNNVVKYTDVRTKEIVTELYSFRTELFKLKLNVTKK
jgi:hypothetical protein